MAKNLDHLDLAPVRLVIFDLDGTLYADTRQFDHYAARLREYVPPAARTAYDRDYAAVKAGRHPLQIGRLYDNDADLILAADRHLRVTAGWRWDGPPVDPSDLRRRYPEPVRPDAEHIVTVGDGWWLPPPCARHHGAVASQEPFLATRRLMLAPEWKMGRIPGLRAALTRLKAGGRRLTVCSNSPDGDVQQVLDKLGLGRLVEDVYPAAGKPVGAVAAYRTLAAGAEGAAVLAIGDNYLNDIAPAEALGYQTLLVNPHGTAYDGYHGPQVRSLNRSVLHGWR